MIYTISFVDSLLHILWKHLASVVYVIMSLYYNPFLSS